MRFGDLAIVLVVFFNMLNSCRASPRPDKLIGLTRKEAYRIDNEEFVQEAVIEHGMIDEAQQRIIRVPRKVRMSKDKHRRWNLEPIKIQLNNVIEKYTVLNPKFDELYYNVKIVCGVNGCQNFRGFIPDPHVEVSKISGKSKKPHHGKKINELLTQFQEGLQKIEKSLETMILYEDSHSIGNDSRRSVLQDLKSSIKSLDVEVESVMNIKNIEIKKIGEDEASRIFLHTANQTDLIVQEWYIIQKSKLFLTGWREIIDTLKNSDSYKLRNRLR